MIKFKVGDRVLLDPRKCTQGDLSDKWSDGIIGRIYTINDIDVFGDIQLSGSNWHKPEWLTKVTPRYVGGRIINPYSYKVNQWFGKIAEKIVGDYAYVVVTLSIVAWIASTSN